ncbi:MAG: hypothetical protein R6X32_00240 [Chloroflexota bacterium]
MQKIAGTLLLVGSAAFLGGVAVPTVTAFFSTSDSAERIAIIQNDPTGWAIGNLSTAVGALIAAIGIIVILRTAQTLTTNSLVRSVCYAGVFLAVISAVTWGIIAYGRITLGAEAIVANQNINLWLFPLNSVSTGLAVILTAFVLLKAGYPKWLGWLMMAASVLLLITLLVTGDLIPAFWYLLFIIVGVTLVVMKNRLVSQAKAPMGTAVSPPQ